MKFENVDLQYAYENDKKGVKIMTSMELNEKVEMIRQYKRIVEEAQAIIDSAQDELKAEMTARSVEELAGDNWRITWHSCQKNGLDTKKLKQERPEVYEIFCTTSSYRRFLLN